MRFIFSIFDKVSFHSNWEKKNQRFFSQDRRDFEKNHLHMISFNPRVLNHYLDVAGIQFYISSRIHSSKGLLISPLRSLKSISKWHIRNQVLFLAPQSRSTHLLHLIKWYYNWPNFSGQTLRDRYWLVCFCWDSQVALAVKNLPADAGDIRNEGLIPGLRRFPGGGHSNPLQ